MKPEIDALEMECVAAGGEEAEVVGGAERGEADRAVGGFVVNGDWGRGKDMVLMGWRRRRWGGGGGAAEGGRRGGGGSPAGDDVAEEIEGDRNEKDEGDD